MVDYLGLVWLFVLFLTALAAMSVTSSGLAFRSKAIWLVAVILLPLFGALAWFFVGRTRARG